MPRINRVGPSINIAHSAPSLLRIVIRRLLARSFVKSVLVSNFIVVPVYIFFNCLFGYKCLSNARFLIFGPLVSQRVLHDLIVEVAADDATENLSMRAVGMVVGSNARLHPNLVLLLSNLVGTLAWSGTGHMRALTSEAAFREELDRSEFAATQAALKLMTLSVALTGDRSHFAHRRLRQAMRRLHVPYSYATVSAVVKAVKNDTLTAETLAEACRPGTLKKVTCAAVTISRVRMFSIRLLQILSSY